MEFWLLAIYDETTSETAKYNKFKEWFWKQVFPNFYLKDKNRLKSQAAFQQYLDLTKDFRNKKSL
jgi:hypothetical protein